MGAYSWVIEHDKSEEEAEEVLRSFDFEENEEGDAFLRTINDWKPLKASVSKGEIEIVFHWMGGKTTEVYFDYLIHAGSLLGQIMMVLDN